MKWTKGKVLRVIRQARRAGEQAADKKVVELEAAGPKYAVCDATAGDRVVGTLLDACGGAHLQISARGKFYLLAKELSKVLTNRFFCRRAYGGGGTLTIFDSTSRQEISVNAAAAKAQAAVLKQHGIKATVRSYLD